MGKVTGKIIKQLRSTGQSSERFGNCDECRKHVSETHVAQSMREFVRDNGDLYSGPIVGGVYGHKECLQVYGPFDEIREAARA